MRAALAAGKHVLCERPLTFDADTDMRLAAEADRRGLGLHVGFWRRHAWPYREARRLIAEGEIGAPRMLRLAQWDAEPLSPAFCDPAVSGGIEIDCGVHECDLAAWICGSPVVEAFARGAPTRSEIAAVGDVESLIGLLVLAGGQPVSLDLARTATHADLVRSEIVGEHGSLICEAHGAGALLVSQDDGFREVLPDDRRRRCSTRSRGRSTRSRPLPRAVRYPTRRGRRTRPRLCGPHRPCSAPAGRAPPSRSEEAPREPPGPVPARLAPDARTAPILCQELALYGAQTWHQWVGWLRP